MKKALAICGAAIIAAAALTACNADDGKVNDNGGTGVLSSEETYSRRNEATDTASGMMTSSRRNDDNSTVSRDRTDNTDTNGGIIEDAGDMVGEGIEDVGDMVGEGVEDVADGLDNIGSSAESDAKDFIDGFNDTENN